MHYGGTRYASSPSYEFGTYSERSHHSRPTLSTTRDSTYTTTYTKTYTSPRTDYHSRSRGTSSPLDYTPSTIGTSLRSTSKSRFRSPSRNRSLRDHSVSRNIPTDTAGRPLPKGPGTRDYHGKPVDHREHLSVLRTNLNRDSSVSRDVRRPVRADHSYGARTVDPVPARLNRSKRTNSVADLTNKFEDISLKTSKRYGSNADLSSVCASSYKADDFTSYRRTSHITDGASPLPDINITNKTSRSPSLDGRDSSVARYYDSDELSSSSKTALENQINKNAITYDSSYSKTNGYLSNGASDYNNNSKGVVGLMNIGNTCFMNTVLQCLSNTKPLLEYCLDERYKADMNTTTSRMKGQLIKVYSSVMKSVWKGTGDTYFNPSEFKNQIAKFARRFVGYNQQDAQEFLICLLEGLHEDVNLVQEKKKRVIDDSNEVESISASEKAKLCWNNYLDHDNSIIVELFVGQLRSALTCTDCDYQSNTFDPFWDLSLPIPKNKNPVALIDCFNLFTQEEFLDGEERPTCARCKKRQRCKKRFYIQRFPKVLIIHLKRFNQGSYYRSKLQTKVEFPINRLDLSPYAAQSKGSPVYNLYAVSNHSGSTGGGHYTAYAKNPYSGKWHYFNDQRVSTVTTESQLQSSEAYVLFYQLESTSHL
ncbi:hypothetical protein LSH36_965g00004 [Paralvinella palmiformis]|uniref:ubiquitinyl hydrolase 1 n=1 Tax=Paralvinella palmiformis TaxID=53620 RepID=A0AAD9MSB9_9ANNE|nr:hypothetical protein LSH36_965g00004 [Paralvinella palmiformis]